MGHARAIRYAVARSAAVSHGRSSAPSSPNVWPGHESGRLPIFQAGCTSQRRGPIVALII